MRNCDVIKLWGVCVFLLWAGKYNICTIKYVKATLTQEDHTCNYNKKKSLIYLQSIQPCNFQANTEKKIQICGCENFKLGPKTTGVTQVLSCKTVIKLNSWHTFITNLNISSLKHLCKGSTFQFILKQDKKVSCKKLKESCKLNLRRYTKQPGGFVLQFCVIKAPKITHLEANVLKLTKVKRY